MLSGNFRWEQVNLAVAHVNGQIYRMNGQHTCFPAGTKIRLADGTLKPIEHVTLMDNVLTAEGRCRGVRQVHSMPHVGHLCRVRLWGHAHLRCTPNHEILTRRGYVSADSLTSDDHVKVPRYAPQWASVITTAEHVSGSSAASRAKSTTFPASSFSHGGRVNHKPVPDAIKLDNDFGRLIWLAPSIHQELTKNRPVWKVTVAVATLGTRHQGLPEVDSDSTWRRVRAIDKEKFAGLVYDLGVDEDHSYVAEGIGVHNCWARIQADEEGLSKKTRCPVQMLQYQCKTVEDARQLYASLDRGRGRGSGLVVTSLLLGTKEFAGYTGPQLKMMSAGYGLWRWDEAHARKWHNADERADMMKTEHHKLTLIVGSIIRESRQRDFRHLKRAAGIAAMFETCNKAPAIAREFWLVVRDGIGVTNKTDPRYALREYLKNTAQCSSEAAGSNLRVATVEDIYRACIQMWNAFRADKEVRLIRIAEGNRPLAR